MASDPVATRVPLDAQEPGKELEFRFCSLDVTGTEKINTGLTEVLGAWITIVEDLIDAQEYPATISIATQATDPGLITAKTWKHTTMNGTDTTPAATTTNPVTCHVLVVGTP